MVKQKPIWQFGPNFPQHRLDRMGHSFEDILARLKNAMVLRFEWEEFKGSDLKGCRRPYFLLSVTPETYDAFFNSPAGYRGQYAISPEAGEAANRILIDALLPVLTQSALVCADIDSVNLSMKSAEAKVWICEQEVAGSMERSDGNFVTCDLWSKSLNGLYPPSPEGSLLEIKGGWLDKHGNTVHNLSKSKRSEEIHLFGYSPKRAS